MMSKNLLIIASMLLPTIVFAAQNSDIRVTLEEPFDGADHGGTLTNIRGWAAAPTGIDRVELYIDGALFQVLPYGGLRGDVGASLPTYANSDESGFSMAANYSLFGAGIHDFKVLAYDTQGDFNEITNQVSITKFAQNRIANPALFDMTTAAIVLVDGQNFLLPNLTVDGEQYGVQVTWQKQSQDLDIIYKVKAGYISAEQDGDWVGRATPNQPFVNSNACHMRTIELTLTASNISGESVNTAYTAFRISGTVNAEGLIQNGIFTELGGRAAGTLAGSIAGGLAGGSWQEPGGCAGSWMALRQ